MGGGGREGWCIGSGVPEDFMAFIGAVRQILQTENDLSEIIQLVGKVCIPSTSSCLSDNWSACVFICDLLCMWEMMEI
jgi:hypothetical protein